MKSIWRETCEIEERKPLDENIETEVAVIGAGMMGILAAYYLQSLSCFVQKIWERKSAAVCAGK